MTSIHEPHSRFDTLLRSMEDLQIFDSVYLSKVLIQLILSTDPMTASSLSIELEIPDSKVYPALNQLTEFGIISVNDNKRPKEYSFVEPEKLQAYLLAQVENDYQNKIQCLDHLNGIISEVWQPEEYFLDNIAQLFRGKEVENQIGRHIKLTKSHLFVFLSRNFKHYDILEKYLKRIDNEQLRLDIVIPGGHQDFISSLEQQVAGKIKLRTSIWNQNSYIIRDHKVMMNMFHSDEDVILLTNDELMVKNVQECWNDQNCCTPVQLLDLELPDDFTFNRIQLV